MAHWPFFLHNININNYCDSKSIWGIISCKSLVVRKLHVWYFFWICIIRYLKKTVKVYAANSVSEKASGGKSIQVLTTYFNEMFWIYGKVLLSCCFQRAEPEEIFVQLGMLGTTCTSTKSLYSSNIKGLLPAVIVKCNFLDGDLRMVGIISF